MADSYRSEYVGFSVNELTREYRLRVTTMGTEARNFTVAIPNKAFLAHRVRYQDAPDICFLKLQRALAAHAELPGARLTVTASELEEYRESHAARPGKPRPKYPIPETEKPQAK
jgi:hypothetical protein